MRFVLDENFPKAAGAFLSERAEFVFDVRDVSGEKIPDAKIFEIAQAHEAVLLTTDRDFFHTVPHLYPRHFGVVVVALSQPNRERILDRLQWLLDHAALGSLENRVIQLRDTSFVIIESEAKNSDEN